MPLSGLQASYFNPQFRYTLGLDAMQKRLFILPAQTQLLDQLLVSLIVLLLKVVQKPSPLAHHH